MPLMLKLAAISQKAVALALVACLAFAVLLLRIYAVFLGLADCSLRRTGRASG